MPNSSSKEIQQAIKQVLPNWEIVGTKSASDSGSAAERSKRARPAAGTASPDLAAIKSKYAGAEATKRKAKRQVADKKSHAQFITVRPSGLSDNAKPFQKVVLVKDKKVLAVQG
jgi:hypothetical protein